MSNDPHFSKYVLQESTGDSSGPWFTVANSISPSTANSYYDYGLQPEGTEWWKVLYYNTTGRQTSFTDPVLVTQPPIATLSLSQVTATALQMSWDNYATYGGLLSFGSYQLIESVNGGPYSIPYTTTSVNSLGYTINVTPSTNYAFYLNTTDQCNGCGVVSSATTESNSVHMSTPGPLSLVASASPNSVDVGQLVYLSCSSAGGTSPYSYSWTFGDGSFGSGANPSHVYNSPGMIDAVCTVTDSLGTIANSEPVAFAVYIDPSITSFTATPASPDLGQRVTLVVSTTGGNGSLTYSYAGLPTGCFSTNSSSFSCTPTSGGIYEVTVTVTDQGRETANSTVRVSIGPSRVLGLPQVMGLAVIFAAILGVGAATILTVFLAIRRKKGIPKQTRT